MKLLTKAIRDKLPPLYATESLSDDEKVVQVKFFTPDSSWTWYTIEWDKEDTFFGLVVGFEVEMGYFSLSELQETTGLWGLHIERDRYFKPCPLNQVPEYKKWIGREEK